MSEWQLGDIHHLGLTVADIERSIEFYRDTLGMTLIGRRPCVEEGYVAKQTGYGGVKLSVASFRIRPDSINSLEIVEYLNHTDEPADTATNRPGGTHLCIVVDDLEAAHQDLKSKGVRFKSDPVEITAGPNKGGKVIYFFDPDNYVLEMFEPARREQPS
jgi:catechol 2,3-dioxygenase-like lactoylglutathione lyase family enzyme